MRDQRGPVLLEFALVFPLLIAFFLGVINFAILLNNNIVASLAARETACVAATTGNATTARQKGEQLINNGLLSGTALVTAQSPTRNNLRVNARVDYTTNVIAPGFTALLGQSPWSSSINLTEETSYYVEYRHRNSLTSSPDVCVWCGCQPGGCR